MKPARTHGNRILLSVEELPDGRARFEIEPGVAPGHWGLILADIVRHIGDMEKPSDETIEHLVQVFRAELRKPTAPMVLG